ncbi:MAG TPA: ester cyclase [Candidatus Angelobacter sp.]
MKRFGTYTSTLVIAIFASLLLALPFSASLSKAAPKAKDSVGQHLKTFDELDFDVYSNQKWDRLQESHADDILVTYPDSHQSKGLKAHIDELKPLFVFAPDTKITTHPIKFGSDDWTCVTGVMTGTFTKPMPAGDGKTIPPTGKSFKINMATVGHWKNGKMIEESLFWDNQEFMKQIGLGK